MSISSDNGFWETVKSSFQYDDGSLPSIELYELKGEEVSSIFEQIMGYGSLNIESSFWHKEKEKDVAIVEVQNAATLVVEGKADSFHFCINVINYQGCELPEIGIFIFEDSIEFDYRMGPEWTKKSTISFFKFMLEMKRISKKGKFMGAEDSESILRGLDWIESEYFTTIRSKGASPRATPLECRVDRSRPNARFCDAVRL
ncbi:MAG: hypothetical protein GY816_00950, partial [Cytophagales bacterium]|nr:hypothetical protein [Cytophagales bacterium]